MDDDFDWSEFRGEEVVKSQQAVVAYENPDGDIVIRQEAAPYDRDDSWVVIPKKDVFQLIQKLKKLTQAN
jgi:hypothetical protein